MKRPKLLLLYFSPVHFFETHLPVLLHYPTILFPFSIEVDTKDPQARETFYSVSTTSILVHTFTVLQIYKERITIPNLIR